MASKNNIDFGVILKYARQVDEDGHNLAEMTKLATDESRSIVRDDSGNIISRGGTYRTYATDARHKFPEIWVPQAVNLIHSGSTEEDEARARAATNLLDYTKYTFPQYAVDNFHQDVAGHLTKMVMGEAGYERLMLFAPPQHGKSELVSTRLPSFWLTHNPDQPVALVSYAGKLAERNSRNAREVLRDPRFKQIVAPHAISPDLENWRIYDWHINGGRGYVLAVGVGGAITGHGFGLIIIDDPIENWAAAQSELLRESTWQWWLGTLKTRLWEKGRIVLMMTRWHKDDLAGRILDEEGTIEEGGLWRVLSYPAISLRPTPAEDWEKTDPELRIRPDALGRGVGEPLAPSRFSIEWLEEQRRTIGRMVWNAEYQQMPTDPEGEFFKIGRIQIETVPPVDICKIQDGEIYDIQTGVRYWDLAATKKSMEARDPDYTSGTLLAESKEDRRYWMLDSIRAQLDPEQVEDMVIQYAKLDGKKVKIRIEQEPGASGKALISYYQRLLAGFDVEGAPASGDKTVKAQPFAGQVNAGNVVMLKGPWNRPMLSEMAGFPNVRHDDQVDSGSGAFNVITAQKARFKRIKFKAV